MVKQLRNYMIFCFFCLSQMVIYIVYAKIILSQETNMGVKISSSLFYGIFGYFFSNMLKFLSLSYSYISQSYTSLILYFYTVLNILFYSLATACYAPRPFLFLGFLTPLVFELLFVLYTLDSFTREVLYKINIKVGSNIKLKRALNVSKK
ncbi:hypothetical protein H312_02234 [Anncaliia algerae PRA339]|uniref:Uncharacterized protein n=1 Tax=Anncaliia algerae PRA339 TaxID=1288291 RepID=A0A059F050_9MICR|nr:hypothetical protein H312_02234 [Anncaliia algerae PRA339]